VWYRHQPCRDVASLASLARLVLAIVAIGALMTPGHARGRGQSEGLEQVRRIHQAAHERPGDSVAFETYLKTLPRFGEDYVVEGDLLMTRDEVFIHLVSRSQTASPVTRPGELLVSLRGGRPEIYPPAQRTLTYAIDRKSFPDTEAYQTVVTNMKAAASEWEKICEACGVKFVHRPELDAGPSNDKVSFTVKIDKISLVALAFFPLDPPSERVLRIDARYFTTKYDRVGVLRHELGHVLGYRHEHIRATNTENFYPSCVEVGGEWKDLTPYDPQSVMHYICDESTGSRRLEITDRDKEGHIRAYTVDKKVGGNGGVPESGGSGTPSTLTLLARAVDKPLDGNQRQKLKAALPTHNGRFVVEGDLRLTDDELNEYLISIAGGERVSGIAAELQVNVHAGRRDFYRTAAERRLTYAIDKPSFGAAKAYELVVENMKAAAVGWESACPECGVRFVHDAEFDEKRLSGSVNFVVRQQETGGAFLAAAFFPHAAGANRTLDIDPALLEMEGLARVGVLRHQLGHILGYRHQPSRGFAGCDSRGRPWDSALIAVTVMNYYCGRSIDAAQFNLAAADVTGHRNLYRDIHTTIPDSTTTATRRPDVLVVRFDGGEVAENAARVLRTLHKHKALPLALHVLNQGDTVESVYRRLLQVPGYPVEMNELAGEINASSFGAGTKLQPGEAVQYPAVVFAPRSFSLTFDAVAEAKELANVRESWKALFISQKEIVVPAAGEQTAAATASSNQSETRYVRVTFRGYELRVPVDKLDAKAIQYLIQDLNGVRSKNVRVYLTSSSSDLPRGSSQASWTHANTMGIAAWKEAYLGSLLKLAGRPQDEITCTAKCPDVVLLDTPIRRHPDIDATILEAEDGQPDVANDPTPFLVDSSGNRVNFVPLAKEHHGTLMAGIIASQENKFGLVGINPKARLFSWNWIKLRDDVSRIFQRVEDRQGLAFNRLSIYVLASEWPRIPPSLDDGLAVALQQNENALMIAAAQQIDSGPPVDFLAGTKEKPAALGNEKNVLIVTACERCDPSDFKLWDRANFSTSDLVHLAAPGVGIPSTMVGGKYTEGTGTSEATAFVAGVASLMAARYPDSYPIGKFLKTRLQVTASPIQLRPEQAAVGVASGVIDANMALLDPAVTWVKTSKDSTTKAVKAASMRLHVSEVKGQKRDFTRPELKLSQIFRISVDANTGTVTAFKKKALPGGKTIVERVGPLTLDNPDEAFVSYELVDGELRPNVSLRELRELLLGRVQ